MPEKNEDNLINRPPVVVVMGHIDHGKTQLLDAIRKTNVVERESGGITQHIGAYEITVSSKKPDLDTRKITFIDTPGHEAFSKMRARGAQVGDVAILVVAADEGVKAQTLEALKNIEEAKIPFIVAINKIDKPEANPDKVKQQLAEAGVYLEGWGGKVPFVLISAKEGKNIDELLELILLVADLEEIKAEQGVAASGVVIEAKMDSRSGPLATLVIKNGVLRQADEIATETTFGKVKILEDFKGTPISEATFSSPVVVGGFKDLPQVGEEFFSGHIELAAAADKAVNIIKKISRQDQTAKKVISLILKVDAAGSLEALEVLVKNFQTADWKFEIISAGVGDIFASDIQNAISTSSWILGFRVKIPKDLEVLAKNNCLKVFLFDVIYDVEKFFKQEMENVLAKLNQKQEGECLILATFSRRKDKQLIGGRITKGKLVKGQEVKVLRNEEELGTGKILNLQTQRKDVREAEEGKEAGIMIECPTEIKIDDKLVVIC